MWWIKAEWGDLVPSVADLMCSPGDIKVPMRIKRSSRPWVWTPPTSGQIKVNLDGSFLGSLGRWGIEGAC